MTEIIQGTCFLMCPEKERWMREKEGLLHAFEIDESTKGARRPKADPRKTIKSFSRSAAGVIMTEPNQLRPASVLLSTTKYLLEKIATRTDVDWIVVYDFVFDRLRSVRQDIAIQRINVPMSIQIFEPIVRFLVYSAQRLCDRSVSEFNAKINNQHISECISHLLVLYDKSDKTESSDLDEIMEKLALSNNREEMEAIHILLNMGNEVALRRALGLAPDLKRSVDIQLSTKISLAWYLKNYARVCSLIRQLPPILVCAAMINIQNIRRAALRIMSSGYNSKVLTFPGLALQDLLLYKDIDKVRADCELFGLAYTDQNVLFQKASFKDEAQSANTEAYYTPRSLHGFLPCILLGPT